MKKSPIWKGNTLGNGQRGGVLHVGAHVVHVGEVVPKGLPGTSEASLRGKGAIVDDYTDKDKAKKAAEEAAAVSRLAADKHKAGLLKEAKKTKTATGKALKEAAEKAGTLEAEAADLDNELGVAQEGLASATADAEGAEGDAKVSLDAEIQAMTEAYGLLRDATAEAISAAGVAANNLVAAEAADGAADEAIERLK